jgi:hypothetical protein
MADVSALESICTVSGSCTGWGCALSYPQGLFFLSSVLGLSILAIATYQYAQGLEESKATPTAIVMAVAVGILLLPALSKFTLNLGEGRPNVALELGASSNPNAQCDLRNIIAEATSEMQRRITALETRAAAAGNLPNPPPTNPGDTETDVRIFYVSGRSQDAAALQAVLSRSYRRVTSVNSDLTEVRQRRPTAGSIRVRYEVYGDANFTDAATKIMTIVRAEFASRNNGLIGPDAVQAALPGDVQILMY